MVRINDVACNGRIQIDIWLSDGSLHQVSHALNLKGIWLEQKELDRLCNDAVEQATTALRDLIKPDRPRSHTRALMDAAGRA